MKLVEKTLQIEALAELVFEMLTQGEHLVRWMAPAADVDAHPGGQIRWTHANGDTCSGRFLELIPGRRVVFTYGWERADVEIPPGSTTVEITLIARGTATELHLVHRGLAGPMADAHTGGWDNYLQRLADVAEGRDTGPDRLARERVPSALPPVRP